MTMPKVTLKVAGSAPSINTAAALELLGPLFDDARTLIKGAEHGEQMRIEALLDGLLSVLSGDQSLSADPANVKDVAGKALALLDMLARFLPEASEDLPLFQKASARIEQFERLLGKRESVPGAVVADRPVFDALNEAYNDICPELAYIKQLSECVWEAREREASADKIEALALSIQLMTERLQTKLERQMNAAREVACG
jgi:hypothetical protein